MSETLNILLIDDDQVDRMLIKRILKSSELKFEFTEAEDGPSGLEKALSDKYDIIFLDYMLPKENGLEVLGKLREKMIETPVIMLTGRGDEETAVNIMKAGAADYLSKDRLTAIRLIHSLENVLKVYRLNNEAKMSQAKLHQLVERTSSLTGYQFLNTLVETSSQVMNIQHVLIASYNTTLDHYDTLAFSTIDDIPEPTDLVLTAELEDFISKNPFRLCEEKGLIEENDYLKLFKTNHFCGAILYNVNQQKLGVFLLINYSENQFTEQDKSILKLFASRVETEIQRQLDQESLIEKESRFRTIFENSFDAIIVFNKENIVLTNQSFARLFAYETVEEIEFLNIYDLIPEHAHQMAKSRLNIYFYPDENLEKPFGSFELKGMRKDGVEIDISINLSLYVQDGKYNIVAIIRDITESKLHEYRLAAEKERLSVTLSSISDAVITVDTNETVILMNKAAEQILECSIDTVVNTKISKVCRLYNTKTGEYVQHIIQQVIKSKRTEEYENHRALHILQGDGFKEKLVSISLAPLKDKDKQILGVVIAFRDITEKQKVEEELSKASKLESIGILAGGIAHDFNNLLTAILGNLSLSKMFLSPQDKAFHRIGEAEKATMLARDLTQQLLTFSKGGTPVKTTESITTLVKDSAEFVLRGTSAEISYEFDEEIYPVDIDVGQINQVINNLLINANQAMPKGGKIHISIRNYYKNEKVKIPLEIGNYVTISIEDTGSGIPAEQLVKIFEPYFTTKKKGSGLGLANCYTIIKRHDGYISVNSEIGVGTQFKIYLPASNNTIEEKTSSDSSQTKGHGCILVMDDDKEIRNIVQQMLLISGYEVLLAEKGEDVLKQMNEKDPNSVRCVMLDLTVRNGMGAIETIKTLKQDRPELKSLVTSGYSNDEVIVNYSTYGFDGAIVKPYEYKELISLLNRLLI